MSEEIVYGRRLRLSLKGQSHSPAMEFALENFPAGIRIDRARLSELMERRAPGRDGMSTSRLEPDWVDLLSGLDGEVTDGGVIRGRIVNIDARPSDYGEERTVPRPGHADFGQWVRYGRIPTGGGMNSGRLTALLCAAGGICAQYLERRGIAVRARIDTVHGKTSGFDREIIAAREALDSVGGTIVCEVTGLPPGVGGALFDGVETELAGAAFAIPGVNGIEFGNGFRAAELRGSENDDPFKIENGAVVTAGNNHGGLLGGRTSGMPLRFRLSMKPTPTVLKSLPSVNLSAMTETRLEMNGRHDPCIVRRAVPVVEAVTAYVLADILASDEYARPRICLTLTGRTLEECLRQYEGERYFTDMVELRADLLDAADRDRLGQFSKMVPVPVILTMRRRADGGEFDGPDSERVEFFRRALRAGFAYVDFEDDFRVDELTALAAENGTTVIRSLHDFSGPLPDVAARCRQLRGNTHEIPKIAFAPQSAADVERLFRETADFTDTPHVVVAMGNLGVSTRILASRTNSFLTYASVSGLEGLGHLSPTELVRSYRIRELSGAYALVGVTGWPLSFTRSPELNNAAFFRGDVNALMVPVPAESAAEAMSFMKQMGMLGMAVTIPHKRSIMALLDRISPEAAAIGAVNTVSFEDGEYVGYNTDAEGFSAAITAFMGRTEFSGIRVAVLGNGGAARAVVHALESLGATVRVFHRAEPSHDFDLIVNATPVDPIPTYVFDGTEAVCDLRYAPELTPLLARAQAAGCRIEDGLPMLKAQAAAQRRIWRLK